MPLHCSDPENMARSNGANGPRSHLGSGKIWWESPCLKRIDEHVRNTPPEATGSLESLAKYISSAASTDLEKVRAIYKWITANVSFDTEGLRNESRKLPTSADLVLRNRVCVCEGYARLMVALCELVNVECRKLSGYSKGASYNPVKTDLAAIPPDHAWNVVKVDGKWHLIEATWGAGHVNEEGEFIRADTDFYFLTDPAIFVETHLPYMNSDMESSEKWQLLKEPIDLQTFHSLVNRQPSCFDHCVELVSHSQALIDATDEVTLRFKGTGKPLTSFGADLADTVTGERVNSSRHIAVVLDHRTNEVTIIVRPPTSGIYWEMKVFGSTVENCTISAMLVSYYIRTSAKSKQPKFPNATDHYGLQLNPEMCGFTRDLGPFWIKAEGGEHELRLPISSLVPDTADLLSFLSGKNADRCTFLETGDGFLRLHLRMYQAGFHRLQLYCKNLCENADSCPLMANFLIECTKPMKRRPFPNATSLTLTERVSLLSPRDGELPAHSEVEFRLSSPTLCKLMVNDGVYDKIGGGFRFVVETGAPGREVCVFGTVDPMSNQFQMLYSFRVAKAV